MEFNLQDLIETIVGIIIISAGVSIPITISGCKKKSNVKQTMKSSDNSIQAGRDYNASKD